MYGVIKLTGISGSHTVSILPTGIGKICIGIWTVKVFLFLLWYIPLQYIIPSHTHTHTHTHMIQTHCLVLLFYFCRLWFQTFTRFNVTNPVYFPNLFFYSLERDDVEEVGDAINEECYTFLFLFPFSFSIRIVRL